ncbi:MAG: hypothetical protein P4L40_21535 [Terracidiphilus sp.]|nr:hypothetical protein [Terracidiphilus sp.]
MNPIQMFKLYGLYRKAQAVAKEKATMKIKIPQLLTLCCSLAATIGLPTVVMGFVHTHPYVYMGVVAAAVILHAVMPSVFAAPSDAETQASGLGKIGMIALALLLSGSMLRAQTVTGTPQAGQSLTAVFTGSSDAVALHYNGEWTAATLVGQQYDFLDFGAKKTNHLSLIGNELVAPGANFNAYLGGLRYEPDLSGLLAKTNVPAGTFALYLEGSAGNGVPSSGGSHVSFLAGGGVKYRATASLSWNALEAQYVRFGSQQGVILSSGLSFIFGSK